PRRRSAPKNSLNWPELPGIWHLTQTQGTSSVAYWTAKMNSTACVKIHRKNGVMTITLNRPEAGNAINLAMAQDLMQASIHADQDAGVRCVLLTASERFFCVGGDVGAFAQSLDQLPGLLTELTSYLNPTVSRLLRMNKPL